MQEFEIFIYLSVVAIVFVILAIVCHFWMYHLRDLRTLRLGRLSLLFWLSILIVFNAIVGIILTIFSDLQLGTILLMIESLSFGVIVIILGLILSIAILVLTFKMWKRERRSVANLLLPIVCFFFFLIDFLYFIINNLLDSWPWLRMLSLIYPALAIYLTWQFVIFFVASIVYGKRTKNIKASYYVVLGAGLINGQKVGRLLANRIKAAIFASSDETIFIMSGGRGNDENLSEAAAMRNYAIEELSVKPNRILLEDQSRTTYENLVNSSELLNKKESFLFFTSDFHVFRAALFAASLGLNAQGGRGGKTLLYYKIPAFIREFIAVMNSQRKKHIIIISGIVVLFIFIAIGMAWL